jgi:uncharacterized protein (DUF427 family)
VDDVPSFPPMITKTDDVAPVPRRIRGYLAGKLVLDTTAALYVWEWPYYPQYYVPVADVAPEVLVDEQKTLSNRRGAIRVHGLRVGETYRPAAVKVLTDSPIAALTNTARIDWAGLDSWFEEDEHPLLPTANRSPAGKPDTERDRQWVSVQRQHVGILLGHC